MKLYYSPGACSLSVHIVLHETGLPFEAVLAPTKTKVLPDGSSYLAVNPLGYVPLLALDNGQTLTEGPAIVQYLADQVPDKQLAPANGTMARYQLQSWLNFIGTELHKGGFGPFFNPAANDDFKAATKTRLMGRLQHVNQQLEGRAFLLGEQFSVADAYLFTVTNWAAPTGVDLGGLAHLLAWRARVAARPAVQAAMKAEQLI
ncbi:MAG: glutathione transferase GstA [Burkholderiales bacterium PBB5]|nr:MAG: glutathione transferase GstA [Burkholderiales bacterium PBB5]